MPFKFEKLEVWHEAMDMAEEINEMAKEFPPYELYNLSSQIRRAADSIALNIAEGSTATTNAEQGRFLNIAIRSANEVVCCLYKSQRRNYITAEKCKKTYDKLDRHVKRLQALRNSVLKK
jgi:four helix bundle protein